MEQNNVNKKIDAGLKLKDISDLDKLPASPFTPKGDSQSIEVFLGKYENGLIEYPNMQRNGVWTVKDQSELIESLIRGIPIPPIYINTYKKKIKGENGEQEKEVWEVLDGRQRITALIDFFMNNTVKINSNLPEGYENLKDYTYKNIEKNNPKFAGKFTQIQIPVQRMDDAPDQLKREFFQKLNKGGKTLTPGELAHSSLDPANGYMLSLMNTQFYDNHVKKTERFGQFVPASKVLHFILKSKQIDNTFEYNKGLHGWKDNIITNATHIQTDLDNLHEQRNDEFIPYLEAEINRVCKLIDDIFGDMEIDSPNNKLVFNMITSLLILEDRSDSHSLSHDDLKQVFTGMVQLWNKGHVPLLRDKLKNNLANITSDEGLLVNECDRMQSTSKQNHADVLENLRNDAYSSYV